MTNTHYKIEELVPIVEELTIKYTSNESSSITYETARMLMSGVIYCINQFFDVSHKKMKEDSMILTLYKSDISAKDAYEEGYRLVIEKVKTALELYNNIMEAFSSYENIAYYDTMVKGMPAFFLYYDAKFNLENHILTLDYPTIKSVDKLSGIHAIYQYLFYISLEQTFLKAFSDDEIMNLLNRFHDYHYDMFLNICSITLQNAIGCLIVQKPITLLKLEKSDLEIIKIFVKEKTKGELEKEISDLIHKITKYCYDDNTILYEYLLSDVSDFTVRLFNAVENNCLEVIFPI